MISENNLKNYVDTEIKNDFLGDVLYLSVKARTFLRVNNVIDAHKSFFRKSKTKPQRYDFKKIYNILESFRNFVINIQKQLF